MGQAISIYTQIGLILLLGLSAKNAILIVEYARDYRKGGMDVRQAAENAGRVRFRPIMMTALAFVFGVMPMLFATGAGAASRVSLGTAVVFGMFINAVVGTLFVPNFWELATMTACSGTRLVVSPARRSAYRAVNWGFSQIQASLPMLRRPRHRARAQPTASPSGRRWVRIRK